MATGAPLGNLQGAAPGRSHRPAEAAGNVRERPERIRQHRADAVPELAEQQLKRLVPLVVTERYLFIFFVCFFFLILHFKNVPKFVGYVRI